MSAPKIDKRDYEEVLTQIRELVPFYTPEWKATDERDSGVALLKIFSQMLMGIINRLNQVPEKNFVAFLNMLGIKLLPATQAVVPVTFHVSIGASEAILIPARTQVAATPVTGGEPIIFETQKNMLATPAKLTDVFSVSYHEDSIFQPMAGFLEGKTLTPFMGNLVTNVNETRLLLENTLGLGKGDILKMNDANPMKVEYVEISKITDTYVDLSDKLQYHHIAGTSVQRITEFELFNGKNKQEHVLFLGHEDLFNIKGQVQIELEIPALGDKVTKLKDQNLVNWYYWGEKKTGDKEEIKTQDWYSFEMGKQQWAE